MAKLQTLKPRLQTINTSRIQSLPSGAVERKRGSAGVKDRIAIKKRDCGLCQECLKNNRVTHGTVVDHKVPLWAGGSDDESNKQLLCDGCHNTKTAKETKERARGG